MQVGLEFFPGTGLPTGTELGNIVIILFKSSILQINHKYQGFFQSYNSNSKLYTDRLQYNSLVITNRWDWTEGCPPLF